MIGIRRTLGARWCSCGWTWRTHTPASSSPARCSTLLSSQAVSLAPGAETQLRLVLCQHCSHVKWLSNLQRPTSCTQLIPPCPLLQYSHAATCGPSSFGGNAARFMPCLWLWRRGRRRHVPLRRRPHEGWMPWRRWCGALHQSHSPGATPPRAACATIFSGGRHG